MDHNATDDDAFDCNLLARYLAGECSPAAAELVRRWVDQSPRHRGEVELLAYAWDTAAGLPSASKLDAMWSEVADALELPRSDLDSVITPIATPVPPPARRWIRKTLAVAAALTVVAGSGALLWRARHADRAASVAQQDTNVREFRTPRGQRGAITLLDGTRVALGPESRLQVRIGEAGPRELVLTGEAVFEVVHSPARPFIVRAGGAVTEDLGTRFGVRAYAGDRVRIVVSEGAVAVRDTLGGNAAVLARRDLAIVDGGGRVLVQHDVDPERYLGWTAGRLVFHHAPLPEVLAQLERWFDVRIVVADSVLRPATVTASFDDDIDDVLQVLEGALDARMERHGRWIYLRARD